MSATIEAPPERKTAIVAAALKVFAAHGYSAGTIREIAAEAGVAEGLIYHYFPSKEALLEAVIRERSILSWFDHPGALREDAPVEVALRELVEEALGRLAQNADVVALVWSQAVINRREGQLVGRLVRDITGRIAAYLDRKVAQGELRPADSTVAARLIAGSLITFTLAQARFSPPLKRLSPDHFADALLDILVNGLGASPEGRRPPGKVPGGGNARGAR